MVDVSSQEAVDRWCRQETHFQATIVAARETGFALIADEVRFNGDAVSGFEVGNRGVRG